MDLSIYKYSEPTRHPNKLKIPVNNLAFDEEGINAFNEIYQHYLHLEQAGEYKRFVATPSGGISVKLENWRGRRWLFTKGKTFGEIVIKAEDGKLYRFIIGCCKTTGEEKQIYGRKAFSYLKSELLKDGVDINELAINNGKEVKESFPKVKIQCTGIPERTYENCHHIDLNSAFPAGMMKFEPKLEKTIRRIYEKRKEDPINKAVLNYSYGFMQSELVGYKFAHISKAGVEFCNEYLDNLTLNLQTRGYRILGYNTDGIWYQGTTPYHDSREGNDIGQWKHDHVNCKLRYKSDGVYEFIEDGIYHPVFRGTSSYERIKPKSDWQWGDLFKAGIIRYIFIDGFGFKEVN